MDTERRGGGEKAGEEEGEAGLLEMMAVMSLPGFDVNCSICPSSGYPPLLHAVWGLIKGNLEEKCLVRVLSVGGLDVNATFEVSGTHLTGLRLAAVNGHEGCTRLLLGAPGVDVNKPDSTHGETPLRATVINGHEGCTRLLIGAPGVDVNKPESTDGRTPLCAAAEIGRAHV